MNKINNTITDTMPVRVELSYLNLIDGYYLLNGELFNGLAYDHRDEMLHNVYQITAGKIIAEQDYGFFHRPGLIKLDYSVIDDDFEPGEVTLYHGTPFNGVTYLYRDGFVWGELLWIDGYDVESISWYPDGSGLIRRYVVTYNEYRCHFEWQYKQLIFAEVEQNRFTASQGFQFTINDKNKIESCVLFGDDVNQLSQIVTRTDLPLPATITLDKLLANSSLADNLFININNDVNFNFFVEHAAFNSIKTVKIPTEGISLAALTRFIEVPHLQSLWFNEKSFSQYNFNKLAPSQRLSKQQQLDERNHALLALLLTIQAKRHCDIKLDTGSTVADLLIKLSLNQAGETKLIIDASENDFNYLLNTLPLANITELDLRQTNLSIETLRKLAQFSQLTQLSLKENKAVDFFDRNKLTDNEKRAVEQQDSIRYHALWQLLIELQRQLHCHIKLTTQSMDIFEQQYGDHKNIRF